MNDDEATTKKIAGHLACGLLSPLFDWSSEEQAAVRAAAEEAEAQADKIIWLEQYRLH
jgi:hypothetical protein